MKSPDPPTTLTGRLKQSIDHDVIQEPGEVVARVVTNVEDARRLELSFVKKDKKGRNVTQAPRPFHRAALWNYKKALLKMLCWRRGEALSIFPPIRSGGMEGGLCARPAQTLGGGIDTGYRQGPRVLTSSMNDMRRNRANTHKIVAKERVSISREKNTG